VAIEVATRWGQEQYINGVRLDELAVALAGRGIGDGWTKLTSNLGDNGQIRLAAAGMACSTRCG
jgi:hypothetical protein